MSRSVIGRFVAKDLYASRWTMIGAVVIAAIALAIAHLGPVGAFTAMILMISAGAAPAAFVCLFLVSMERKEKVHLFCLSLPVSGRQYEVAKLIAAVLAFLIPWTAIAVAVLVLVAVLPLPTALLPIGWLFWTFALDLFAMLLVVTMLGNSDGLNTAAIVVFNSSFAFYFFMIQRVPGVGGHALDAHAYWSPVVFQIIAVQLLIATALILLTLWRLYKKRDFT